MNKRVLELIMSENIELVRLGIILLLHSHTEEEVREMVPWNCFTYQGHNKTGIIGVPKFKEPFHLSIYLENIDIPMRIFIKGNIAVTILSGRLICRSVGLMAVYNDFKEATKIYLDGQDS
jgi:hypothetical protein